MAETIQILYGVKEWKPIEYTLYRLKPIGFFKWFKNQNLGCLECEFLKVTGDFDLLALNALEAGLKFKVIDG